MKKLDKGQETFNLSREARDGSDRDPGDFAWQLIGEAFGLDFARLVATATERDGSGRFPDRIEQDVADRNADLSPGTPADSADRVKDAPLMTHRLEHGLPFSDEELELMIARLQEKMPEIRDEILAVLDAFLPTAQMGDPIEAGRTNIDFAASLRLGAIDLPPLGLPFDIIG